MRYTLKSILVFVSIVAMASLVIGLTSYRAYALSGAPAVAENSHTRSVVRLVNLPYNQNLNDIRDQYERRRAKLAATCTGTLINQDIIVTSGHCVMGIEWSSDPTTTRYQVPKFMFDGRWKRTIDGVKLEVYIDYPHGTEMITASHYSSPPMLADNGHDDIALIKLDRPVSSELITPPEIDYTISEPTSDLTLLAFGPNCANPSLRRYKASGRYSKSSYNSTGPNYFTINPRRTDVLGCGGDSGSGVFQNGKLVGVLQKAGAGIGVVKTFGRGGLTETGGLKPDIAAWLRNQVWCSHSGAKLYTPDVDGDGQNDLVCHTTSSGWMDIDYAKDGFKGTDYQDNKPWCSHPGAKLYFGDVNGDNRADRICHTKSSGITVIAYGRINGTFGGGSDWQSSTRWCAHRGSEFHIADMNGDGRSDRVCWTQSSGTIDINYAQTTRTHYAFGPRKEHFSLNGWCTQPGQFLSFPLLNKEDKRADYMCETPASYAHDTYLNGSGGQPDRRTGKSIRLPNPLPPIDPRRLD